MKKYRHILLFSSVFSLTTIAILFYQKGTTIGYTLTKYYGLYVVDQFLSHQDAENFFLLGSYYFGEGGYNLVKAKENYQETLAIESTYPRAHYQLARIYFIEGNFKNALREIDAEIRIFPDYRRSLYIRGLIHGYSGQLDQAIADFQGFLEWKPESWAGHNDLVWVYFQKGDYENARKVAADGLTFVPNNPWLENSLGVALLNLGQLKEAKISLGKALLHAKNLSPDEWGEAYPGNNPKLYDNGLQAMLDSIQKNLNLVQEKTIDKEVKP